MWWLVIIILLSVLIVIKANKKRNCSICDVPIKKIAYSWKGEETG